MKHLLQKDDRINKGILTIGIAVLLLSVGLSGCIEKSDSDKIIGTWESTYGTKWIFREDTIYIGDVELHYTIGEDVNMDLKYIRMYEGLSWHTEKIRNWSYEFDGNDILKMNKHRTPEEYEEEIEPHHLDYLIESGLMEEWEAELVRFNAKYDILDSYILTRVE